MMSNPSRKAFGMIGIISLVRVGVYFWEVNDNHTHQWVNWYKAEREESKNEPEDQREARINNAWNKVVEKFAEHGEYHLSLMAVKGTLDFKLLSHFIPVWAIKCFNLLKQIKGLLSNTNAAQIFQIVRDRANTLLKDERIPRTMHQWLKLAQVAKLGEGLIQQFFDGLRAVCEYTRNFITGTILCAVNLINDQVLTYSFQFLATTEYLRRTISTRLRPLLETMLCNVQMGPDRQFAKMS